MTTAIIGTGGIGSVWAFWARGSLREVSGDIFPGQSGSSNVAR
jgi:hypothetical protein